MSFDPSGAAARIAQVASSRLIAACRLLKVLYQRADVVQSLARRAQIRQRYKKGDRLSELAREYGISPQRVWRIVNRR